MPEALSGSIRVGMAEPVGSRPAQFAAHTAAHTHAGQLAFIATAKEIAVLVRQAEPAE